MADFVPPSDLFHLGPVLDDIRTKIASGAADRGILITNQNAQQAQLSQFLATLQGLESAISSVSAQLSANIAAVNSALAAKIDSLATAVSALGADLSAKLDIFNEGNANLQTLLKAMIQAFQGVATVDQLNQALLLLEELVQVTSPEQPRTLRLDVSNPVTIPQPIPPSPGPR